MKHSNNISTIDYLRDFIVSNNDNMRNNGMNGKSKGDLMKVVYGENYKNVDSALPLGLLDKVGVKNDESWRYVMDYQNNSFGKLTDLINSIAQKNPNVVVYDDSYKEVDNLPILSAMKKYKKSNYMFDFDKTQYKRGGGIAELTSVEEVIIDERIAYYYDNEDYTDDIDELVSFVIEGGEIDGKKYELIKKYILRRGNKYANGGGVDDKPSKKEMLDYLNMYFDNYSELRTIAIEKDNILTRKMLNSLDNDGLEMAYDDAKYEIKADTQYKRGGGIKSDNNDVRVKALIKNLDNTPYSIGLAILRERLLTYTQNDLKRMEENPSAFDNFYISNAMYKDYFNRVIEELKFDYENGGSIDSGNVELANEKYLNSIPLDKKTRILQNIADHYGISEEQAYEEVTHITSEALYEYITDQNLKMHVYQMMK